LLMIVWVILRSPLGLAFQSIRDNASRAEIVGYPINRIRLISYTLSGVITGVAGMLYPPLEGAITPDALYWTFSAAIVFMAILGGARTFLGPYIGGIIYIYLLSMPKYENECIFGAN